MNNTRTQKEALALLVSINGDIQQVEATRELLVNLINNKKAQKALLVEAQKITYYGCGFDLQDGAIEALEVEVKHLTSCYKNALETLAQLQNEAKLLKAESMANVETVLQALESVTDGNFTDKEALNDLKGLVASKVENGDFKATIENLSRIGNLLSPNLFGACILEVVRLLQEA